MFVFMIGFGLFVRIDRIFLCDIYYCLSLYKRVCYDDKGLIGRDQGRFI